MRTVLAAVLGITVAAGCTESTEPTAFLLEVHAGTSGQAADIDPDGYTLTLGSGPPIRIPANGIIKVTDAPPGVHEVKLTGVAANCTLLAPINQSIQLWDNVRTPTRLAIAAACQPNAGAIRVRTETQGDDTDANGYTVSIRRSDGGAPVALAVTANGEATRVVGAGTVEATLDDVAGNCRVDGANPRTLEIEHAEFRDVSFSLSCVANGSLSVSLQTAGELLDQNGYVISVRQSGRPVAERHVAATSTTTIPGVAPGDYDLYLTGVAFNCDAGEPVPANVRSRETTDLTLHVSCVSSPEIAFAQRDGGAANIAMMAIDGSARRSVTASPELELDPAWSPDGRRIAFTRVYGVSSGISVISADGLNQSNLTTSLTDLDSRPDWSPDGQQIVFARYRDGNTDIWVMDADGSNQSRITSDLSAESDPSWSPDGKQIAFSRGQGSSSSIYVMNVDGSNVTPVAGTTNGRQPSWSPDGTKLAFARLDVSGYWSIEVFNFEDGKVLAVVSNSVSANDPTWSPDGKAIAFAGEDPVCYYPYYGSCDVRTVIVDLQGSIIVPGLVSHRESNPDWRPRRP